jgi:hypothetical protein
MTRSTRFSYGERGVKETGFGQRYEVDGELVALDGRRPRLRTVW